MRARAAGAGTDRTFRAAGVVLGVALVLAGQAILRPSTEGAPCRPEPPPDGWSAARQWNEATLAAIRRDLPAPTVHSRNLFHVSVAMWDAWAAFDDAARGYVVDETHHAADVAAARDEAIDYAAYRVLEHRYRASIGASDSLPEFAALMAARCRPTTFTRTEGGSPAALGNRIAAAVLAEARDDGANETGGYASPDGYRSVNPPLEVAASDVTVVDPNRWQPLQLATMISQNGIPVEGGVQSFVGPHWGHVAGFALPDAGSDGLPMDPGPPPRFGDPVTDEAYREAVVEVIRASSRLGPDDGDVIDISPGAFGNNPLGSNDGRGHERNPVTGEPYAPNPVDAADFYRVLAEYWADGPRSETPPGHWNALANTVSDDLDPDLHIGGGGPAVDRLEWDVKLYLTLNAATHDAAVVAWGVKGHYDHVRPITMIRYLGSLGQSSDPNAPAYHPDGLPLVSDLIEVVTEDTSRPGARHAALAGHAGRVAVRAWTGLPEDPAHEVGGVDWILATDWIPYQLPTFVTPAFAGYVSGHSTFSHASARVLTEFTGSPFFPGGMGTWTVEAGGLEFEAGPSRDVVLQWATYADAADQAGISRIYGGIHVPPDDVGGRRLGAACGQAAWALASAYFTGAGPDAS
ncbi:DUF6851 domain-containing protein [Nitriliruptor alkaliphilus]|uniref:DUF6851 domain-containing protein n=1 Tax=Nitriliruptor alkaliphilus TaxID=427918 RepID=UPI00146FC8AD